MKSYATYSLLLAMTLTTLGCTADVDTTEDSVKIEAARWSTGKASIPHRGRITPIRSFRLPPTRC